MSTHLARSGELIRSPAHADLGTLTLLVQKMLVLEFSSLVNVISHFFKIRQADLLVVQHYNIPLTALTTYVANRDPCTTSHLVVVVSNMLSHGGGVQYNASSPSRLQLTNPADMHKLHSLTGTATAAST
ncbi:hypothetical protein IAQ61_009786 [Plenodomus lingam]|uniref:uncharacterized protein n=1 Tax=Leptosphaeria maculans TaxID=5022 RepID=UPI003328A17F|nr:hypothetical protein IAQ61_009786 [Plenodomus lingam]